MESLIQRANHFTTDSFSFYSHSTQFTKAWALRYFWLC
jgi:hypothetical protein